ncbi:cyclohexa-1,5-dienecarbonyl-CoA hydratase [Planctomycetota bacterium]
MSETNAEGPIRTESLEGGAILKAVLAKPKGNILDKAMVESLGDTIATAAKDPFVKAVVIEGEGAHFSFGASVEEHLPEQVESMLKGFHGLFRTMLDSALPTLAVVRGRCLGGGLEVASFCHRVFGSPDAALGQPEIVLGVFAPVASVFLAERVGRGNAEDLCLSGRVVGAEEALKMGLLDEVAEDPAQAALAYAKEHLLPRSAKSLRFAVKAVRYGLQERFTAEIAAVERLYLQELMATRDACEGLKSFIEKRKPVWRNQ